MILTTTINNRDLKILKLRVEKTGRYCNYNCNYCKPSSNMPVVFVAKEETESTMLELIDEKPDIIYYTNVSEPTAHPDFDEIMKMIKRIKDERFPSALFVLSTNGFGIDKDGVKYSDYVSLKLDAWNEDSFQLINKPPAGVSFDRIVKIAKTLDNLHLQSIFYNENKDHVDEWLEVVLYINPESVMIFTLDGLATPDNNSLEKVSDEFINDIKDKLIQHCIPVNINVTNYNYRDYRYVESE